jgi:RNA polymerase sigma factor (sigma-70 family)
VKPEAASVATLEELTPWALRIAWRIAARRGQLHYKEDLGAVALYALSRAIDAHDPAEGEIKPFAAAWIRGEVNNAADEEAGHAESLPPALHVEELAHEVLEALLDLYVGEALRSHGEAVFLRAESAAALLRQLDDLDAEDRRLVDARYWQGCKWKEIAAQLGVSDRVAKERDHRIREHLRKALLAWDRIRPLRRRP